MTARVRGADARPVLVKLSPIAWRTSRELARAAEAGGADALTLTNTARGMVLNRWTGQPLLGGGAGGVSGPALRPQALAAVATARAAVAIALVGLGGIETADDAARLPRGGGGGGRGRHRDLPRPAAPRPRPRRPRRKLTLK